MHSEMLSCGALRNASYLERKINGQHRPVLASMLPWCPFLLGLFGWFCTTLLVLASAEMDVLTPGPMNINRSLQEQEVRNMYQMIASAFQQWVTYELPKPLVLPGRRTSQLLCLLTTHELLLLWWHSGMFLHCVLNLFMLLTSIMSHGNEFHNLIIH